jgi:hypothetical protein
LFIWRCIFTYAPHINDKGYIVWHRDNGSNSEIFLYNGSTTIRLTDNSFPEAGYQINNNGYVVWHGWNGTSWEIFLYTPESLMLTPDIRVNGSDVPITVSAGDPLTLTGQRNAGSMSGQNADWWVGVNIAPSLPEDWYHYDLSLGWLQGITPTYQGPLFNLSPYDIPRMSGLPVGTCTFYLAVDMVMNGLLDLDQVYYDSFQVTIIP